VAGLKRRVTERSLVLVAGTGSDRSSDTGNLWKEFRRKDLAGPATLLAVKFKYPHCPISMRVFVLLKNDALLKPRHPFRHRRTTVAIEPVPAS
jgi:hypothetical protein